jgi:hypothetical protein
MRARPYRSTRPAQLDAGGVSGRGVEAGHRALESIHRHGQRIVERAVLEFEPPSFHAQPRHRRVKSGPARIIAPAERARKIELSILAEDEMRAGRLRDHFVRIEGMRREARLRRLQRFPAEQRLAGPGVERFQAVHRQASFVE